MRSHATSSATRGRPSATSSAASTRRADALVFPFVVTPVRDLLERHPRHRTAHAALLTNILDVLGGSSLPLRRLEPAALAEALSESELRVLRFLPSNLSAREIAGRALRLDQHGQDPHAPHLREARCASAHRGSRSGARSGAARTIGAIGSLGRLRPRGHTRTNWWMCAHPTAADDLARGRTLSADGLRDPRARRPE